MSDNEVAEAIRGVEGAIADRRAARGEDAAGGSVGCLIEAVMGITAGLCQIASAIREHTEAVNGLGERVQTALDDFNPNLGVVGVELSMGDDPLRVVLSTDTNEPISVDVAPP